MAQVMKAKREENIPVLSGRLVYEIKFQNEQMIKDVLERSVCRMQHLCLLKNSSSDTS